MRINLFESRRGAVHILGGILLILAILYVPHIKVILFSLTVILLVLMLIAREYHVPGITHALCLLERKCNRDFPGCGLIFYILSAVISLHFFTQNIALASISILAFGDPVSGFVGRNFGRTKTFLNKYKNIEGTFFGILISSIVASLFVSWPLAIFGGLVGMFFELVGIRLGGQKIDDNLIIPIVSGIGMSLLASII